MRSVTRWVQEHGFTTTFVVITIVIAAGNTVLRQKQFEYYPSSYYKVQNLVAHVQEYALVETRDDAVESQSGRSAVTLASLSAVDVTGGGSDRALEVIGNSVAPNLPVLTTVSSAIFAEPQPAPETETSTETTAEDAEPEPIPLFREYTVQAGDTLSTIAALNGITSTTLLQANGLKETSNIKPGDTLTIPAASGIIVTVKAGDTFSALIQKYKANAEKTLIINDLASGSTIKIGEKILLVNGTEPPKPTPVPQPATTSTRTASTGGSSTPPVEISRTSGSYHKPVAYGVSHGRIHSNNGVDISGNNGASVYAFKSGTVIESKPTGWNGGYGNMIKVKHADGTVTLYAHLQANYASVGQAVEKGQVIGKVGNTGRSTGPHLHFEVRGGTNPYGGYRGNV